MTGQAYDATLIGMLIVGFEKNEMLDGFHIRTLPLPDDAAAKRKFAEFAEEGRRWKGESTRRSSAGERQMVAWAEMEILQAGRGVMVRVTAPRFDDWWNDAANWAGDAMREVFDWIDEDGRCS